MSSIYKSPEARQKIMALYAEKLQSLDHAYECMDVKTSYGRTRVVKMGNPKGPKVMLFHAFNAGAPLTLEAVKEMADSYCFYVAETPGQATHSEETRMNIKDASMGKWADEVMGHLKMEHVPVIGISYGAFLVQKLIQYHPRRISKCIFVVPSGLVNGDVWPSITRLTLPLIKYQITKNDRDLQRFLRAFVPDNEDFLMRMLKNFMTGIKLDTRIPPLLKKNQVRHFDGAVYAIVADDDVYFPGDKVVKRCSELFDNFKDHHVLKNSKHMPSKQHYRAIQEKLAAWLS